MNTSHQTFFDEQDPGGFSWLFLGSSWLLLALPGSSWLLLAYTTPIENALTLGRLLWPLPAKIPQALVPP